jgi:hypothetical protein
VRLLVQLDVGEGQPRRLGGPLHPLAAAQHRTDAGQHLVEAEGLGDVVVAAQGQPGHLVLGRISCGEEQDGGVGAVLAQPPDDAEPVEAGHHHVEHQQVGAELLGEGERLLAIGRGGHLEAGVAQARRQQFADVRLVVDHEQPGLGLLSARGRRG